VAAASHLLSVSIASSPVKDDIGLLSDHSLLLDGSQRDLIHARRSFVAAHSFPRFPQNVTPVDPVIQRMKTPCPAPLGTHP
jgi:hypothetical protein